MVDDKSPATPDHLTLAFYKWRRGFDLAGRFLFYCLWFGISLVILAGWKYAVGKDTGVDVSIILQWAAGQPSIYGPWLIALMALFYARRERLLRLQKTDYFTSRISNLESQIDPNRTTSGLLNTGETNPEHELK